jgi:V/A-type H+-transporting ATPase subunit K
LWALPALAVEPVLTAPSVDASVMRWGLVAAGATTAISSFAASFAVARVGSAAVGALAEKPELFGRVVVLVGLAEGIAIYGLIASILILNRLP